MGFAGKERIVSCCTCDACSEDKRMSSTHSKKLITLFTINCVNGGLPFASITSLPWELATIQFTKLMSGFPK